MRLATDLRIGEVCAITWDCIDFEAGTVSTGGIVVRVPGKQCRGDEWFRPLSEGLYHFMAVSIGAIAWLCTVVGLAILIYRRRTVGPVFSATTRMDKTMYVFLSAVILLGLWNTVASNIFGHYDYRDGVSVWFRGIFRFDLHPELMAQPPLGFQIHGMLAMLLFALWPFTRLVHVFSAPPATCGGRTWSSAAASRGSAPAHRSGAGSGREWHPSLNFGHLIVGQAGRSATVRRTAESSTAARACRCGGMTSRSPGPASLPSSTVVSRTRPRRTCRVASPGLLCSARPEPAVRAMRVCRSACSCPPCTVCALRPLPAVRATASCSSARVVRETASMSLPSGLRGLYQQECPRFRKGTR